MRSLLDGWLGVIANDRYKIEVIKTTAPKLAITSELWFYITKTYHHGGDGQHSIGLPEHELLELIDILNNAKIRKG